VAIKGRRKFWRTESVLRKSTGSFRIGGERSNLHLEKRGAICGKQPRPRVKNRLCFSHGGGKLNCYSGGVEDSKRLDRSPFSVKEWVRPLKGKRGRERSSGPVPRSDQTGRQKREKGVATDIPACPTFDRSPHNQIHFSLL